MSKNLLSDVDIFKGLDSPELDLLAKSAKKMAFAENKIIFKENEDGNKMYLILQGTVEIWKGEGEEIKGTRLARLKQGEIFGEMALFDNEPRSATAIASINHETKILCWNKKELSQVIQNNPKVGLKILTNVLQKVSHRLRIANEAIHTVLKSNQYIGL